MEVAIENSIKVANRIHEPIKPFIRWAGGKQNLVKKLYSHIPADLTGTYFEPFLGAGSLFFLSNFSKSVLSDINPHLINAYTQIKHDPYEVCNRIQRHKEKLNREYYYKVRSDFNESREKFDVEQAARFIFLVHTSFNGIYRINKRGEYNVPAGKLKPALPTLHHLIAVQAKLKDAELCNCMYQDSVLKISSNDFVYFDPPYPPLNSTSAFQHYTIDKFPESKQIELSEIANSLANKGIKVLISNAETPLIKDLYKNWNIEPITARRFINCKANRSNVTELIIKNY